MTMKKKSHPNFNVPNFGAKNRSRVKERWRKQRGVDSKKRVKKRFAGAEPTIGYRNPEQLRGLRGNGRRAVLVANLAQLKEFMSSGEAQNCDITLASALSRRKKAEITAVARQNSIRVTNGA